jgi:hypothetical protein
VIDPCTIGEWCAAMLAVWEGPDSVRRLADRHVTAYAEAGHADCLKH